MSIHYDENKLTIRALDARSAFHTEREFERFLNHARDHLEESERPASLRAWTDLAETWRISEALRECRGNRTAAARLLGIGRRTLYAKMDKLGIKPAWRI